jgi:para-nitrobenzyl esterase
MPITSKVLLRALFLVAVLATSAITLAQSPKALTESGAISGLRESGLSVYKGVPFAAPPIGDLRWRSPVPVVPWTGTRKTDAFAPACMQTGVSMPGETPPTVNEDCLYLNIWTPAQSVHQHLPVLVWIYGGGYINGPASMPLYWGDRLAHRGVIVVTIAYRLGPLGFLAHPELTRESPHHSSGNYGLMDQSRPRMDSEEHRSFWRRPEKCNHRRSILGTDLGQHFDGLASCERPV